MIAPHPDERPFRLRAEDLLPGPPTPKQSQFLSLPQAYGLYCGGWGSGKTTVGLPWAILEASRPANIGDTVAILAPTHKISDEVHRVELEAIFRRFANQHGWSLLAREDKSRSAYHLTTGGRLLRLSYQANPERLSGLNLCAALMDEVDKEPGGERPWKILMSRVRRGTKRIRVVTTPCGYQGVTRLFIDARKTDRGRRRWGVVHSPSTANPHLDPEMLEAWRESMSVADWRQFVEAEILRPGAAVWPEFDRRRHLVDWYPAGRSREPLQWYAAIDWGYNVAYLLAGSLVRGLVPTARDHETLVIWHFRALEEEAQEAPLWALSELREQLGCDPVAIFPDSNNRNMVRKLRDEYSRSLVHAKPGNHDVWASVQRVRSWLDPASGTPPRLAVHRPLALQGEQNPVLCIENYRRRQVAGVTLDEVAPRQRWEHGADAVRYMVDGVDRIGAGGFYIVR